MLISIYKSELLDIEKEYENAIAGSIADEDDVFIPLKHFGICVIQKSKCRRIIDEAQKQFDKGKKTVQIIVDPY